MRRLKVLGASIQTLLDIYKLFCRSVLEYGAPVWSGDISNGNVNQIERVQRNALKIIFGGGSNYEDLLEEIEEDSLKERRNKLCTNLAEKCLKDPKFAKWFKDGIKTRNTVHFVEPEAKTKRYRKSAIPHLTRLLNSRS